MKKNKVLKLYYTFKGLIPRSVQVAARRRAARLLRSIHRSTWPIDHGAAIMPNGFTGWPGGKKFAFVLRHDVETFAGSRHCLDILAIERKFGMRSAFFFVPEDYTVEESLRKALCAAGCEVGVHGLKHDGKLYESKKAFRIQAARINGYLREWNAVGFASPSTHHCFDWLHKLEILYDTSSFDSDPFEPQPDGLRTIFPAMIRHPKSMHSFIELPYTLAQDFTLFVILQEESIRIWRRKLDWVAANGGMVFVNTHPDYMRFIDENGGEFGYPPRFYEELLAYVEKKYPGAYWSALPREVAEFWRTQSIETGPARK